MAEGYDLNEFAAGVEEQLGNNWHRLSAVYGAAPAVFPWAVPLDDWRPTALACLARGHYAQQSVFALAGRRPDAAVMVRVAFEHLVTFAWLMIDPEKHHLMLLRDELNHTTNLLNDLNEQEGSGYNLAAEALSALEALASKDGSPRFVTQAERADAYWSAAIPNRAWQFRNAYAHLYRPYSAFVHPLPSGFMKFIDSDADRTQIVLPDGTVPGFVFAGSTVLLSDALVIASERLGWSIREAIDREAMHGLAVVDGVLRRKGEG